MILCNFPYDYVYFKAIELFCKFTTFSGPFPYDYVYFKARPYHQRIVNEYIAFHTITSILKLEALLSLPIGLRQDFPYDYVYFKAYSCCEFSIWGQMNFPYDYVYFKAWDCYRESDDSGQAFPYDYVYFKAVAAANEYTAGIKSFHTITSILKHTNTDNTRTLIGLLSIRLRLF